MFLYESLWIRKYFFEFFLYSQKIYYWKTTWPWRFLTLVWLLISKKGNCLQVREGYPTKRQWCGFVGCVWLSSCDYGYGCCMGILYMKWWRISDFSFFRFFFWLSKTLGRGSYLHTNSAHPRPFSQIPITQVLTVEWAAWSRSSYGSNLIPRWTRMHLIPKLTHAVIFSFFYSYRRVMWDAWLHVSRNAEVQYEFRWCQRLRQGDWPLGVRGHHVHTVSS